MTTYLSGMGKNEGLSLQALAQKLVMLFSLTHPSRAADLVQLNIAYLKFHPEGVQMYVLHLRTGQSSPD